jgi:heme oxygenase
LAKETQVHHAPADADRLALMRVTTVAEYRVLLSRIFRLESPVELAVSRVLRREPMVASLRQRVGRLHDDLVSLGMTNFEIASLSRCPAVQVQTVGEALGWMFVLQRSTLLAGLIRRYLATELPAAIESASAYLDTHSSGAGSQFRVFSDFMCEHVRRGSVDPHGLLGSTTRAFQLQRYWYARAMPARPSAEVRPTEVRP